MSRIILNDPDELNSYYSINLQYEFYKNTYFVFGSNLAGRHGKGAAKTALMEYNAVYGVGKGFTGMCYAIPTKDKYINTLPLDVIANYIEEFRLETINTDRKYFVTAIGTGLAGYKHEQIAPLFKGVRNCWLPDVWKFYLTEELKMAAKDPEWDTSDPRDIPAEEQAENREDNDTTCDEYHKENNDD